MNKMSYEHSFMHGCVRFIITICANCFGDGVVPNNALFEFLPYEFLPHVICEQCNGKGEWVSDVIGLSGT